MRAAVVRLVLASVLFVGWIGYLAYLVFTASNPVVLSRPQLLVADLTVLARIDDPKSKTAVIEEVFRVRDGAAPKVGDTITVHNLDQCHRLPHDDEDPASVPSDWTGPGLYILPLQRLKEKGGYLVEQVPPSPGYPPSRVPGEGAARIYPLTPQTREQLERLP